MKNNPIGFIDSGLGGLTVLKETIKILPNEKYLYYADNLNNPYGNKSLDELFVLACNGIDYLLKENCKLIVIACSTISSNIMERIYDKYRDIHFIITLPYLDTNIISNYDNVLFIATNGTCNSDYVNNIKKNNSNLKILPAPLLASLIESNNYNDIEQYLYSILSNYNNIDLVVLGCTHYPFVKNIISNILKTNNFIDSSLKISKEIYSYLNDNNLLSDEIGNVKIYNTKNDTEYEELCYKKIKD